MTYKPEDAAHAECLLLLF